MVKTITAHTQIDGLHNWPEAPENRAYLRNLHRHVFHATATATVEHNERDIEFHNLGDLLHVLLEQQSTQYHKDSLLRNFGAQSCETIAEAILNGLIQIGVPVTSVAVSEDNEFTATVQA